MYDCVYGHGHIKRFLWPTKLIGFVGFICSFQNGEHRELQQN